MICELYGTTEFTPYPINDLIRCDCGRLCEELTPEGTLPVHESKVNHTLAGGGTAVEWYTNRKRKQPKEKRKATVPTMPFGLSSAQPG